MFKHNLLIIYRNFKRYKSSFFINLIGLSTGLACTLLIYLWVSDELSIDKFNEYDSRLFRIFEHRVRDGGVWTAYSSPGLMAETLMAEMPEVEYAASSTQSREFTLSIDTENIKTKGRYAGKDFFNMFSYPLTQGNKNQVLLEKNSMVISESLALKLFSTTDNVTGKMVTLEHKEQFLVSGVFKDVPVNATEQFEFVLNYEKFKEGKEWLLNWGNTAVLTDVLLKPDANVNAFNAKITDYIKVKTNNEITHRTPFLKQYSEIYLYGKYENGVMTGGRITYVKLFSIIAAFILIIACINFMNLSTARATRRAKEVGIKKAVGAGRRVLVFQYLGESMLVSFISLLLALLIVDLFLPQFNLITGKQLTLDFNTRLILSAVIVTSITGLISGSYPALYLSGFSPAAVLKSRFTTSIGEIWARKGLVVFQFALSILFIVSVMVVYKQIEFVQSVPLGYKKDHVIYVRLNGALQDVSNQESLIAEIKTLPGVVNASSISHDMTGHNNGTSGVIWEGKNPDDRTEFEIIRVNHGMIETLGIDMTAGRTFSPEFSADTTSIIFNEKGIAFMGLKDPIGKTVKLWGKDMRIVGVTKDFHFESLHENVKPLFFVLNPYDTYLLMVRLTAGTEKETLAKVQQLYHKFNPDFTFDYRFVDDDYQLQYAAEQRVSILSRYFAGLAILISCLGLFGLAAFTAERRMKEIGIRKVLGATDFGIVSLLSGDFTKIVFTSIVIALPLSYLVTSYWLDSFAYKIPLQWWYFISAGAVALFIAWFTVGLQAVKAAGVNPTQCLKDE
jgi:putative ABC transport system permease protein